MALMFIGGASGSTAGGIKVNTFAVLLIAIASTVRGQPSAMAFGRRIEHAIVYRALAVALLAIAFVFLVGIGLTLTTEATFVQTLFEAVSAFAHGRGQHRHHARAGRRGPADHGRWRCSSGGSGR